MVVVAALITLNLNSALRRRGLREILGIRHQSRKKLDCLIIRAAGRGGGGTDSEKCVGVGFFAALRAGFAKNCVLGAGFASTAIRRRSGGRR
jgi:hypothetical protein